MILRFCFATVFRVTFFIGLTNDIGKLIELYKKNKSKDLSMPLITKQAKILEKTISQGSVEWYNVELEDRERLKLRNLKAKTMIIAAGDTGMLSYRGKTIVEFNRG